MTTWLDKRLIIALHDRQLAEHGGSSGLRDESLLESALARPQQLLAYAESPPRVAELAASLAFGLARNHAFVDGNKRTAYVTCRTFIELNDAILSADAKDKYLTFLALGEGHVSEAELAYWLRQHMLVSQNKDLQEDPAPYQEQQGQLK